jgi:hypothetical protein
MSQLSTCLKSVSKCFSDLLHELFLRDIPAMSALMLRGIQAFSTLIQGTDNRLKVIVIILISLFVDNLSNAVILQRELSVICH